MSEVQHLKTGMSGLDTLLHGGLVLPTPNKGLMILIRGKPGTGKTTMALQIALGAEYLWGLPASECHYHSFEQDREELNAKLYHLCARYPKKDQSTVRINVLTDYLSVRKTTDMERGIEPAEFGKTDVNDLIASLRSLGSRQQDDANRLRLLVVDGLNLLSTRARDAADMEGLIVAMRKHCQVGILVYEPSEHGYANIDYRCDVVIELAGDNSAGSEKYYLNQLRITKSRFQKSVLGWQQYKIRDDGIDVFPSIHFMLSRIKPLRKRFEDSKLSITKLPAEHREAIGGEDSLSASFLSRGNLKKGSCTVLLGPRRTLKTLITFDFLRAGSRRGKHGLLVSLIDNQGTIIDQRCELCKMDCRKSNECPDHQKCYSSLHLLHYPPGCITTSEFMDTLERRLRYGEEERQPIERLVFWDLAQLQDRYPLLYGDPMFLPGLMECLKNSFRKGRDRGNRRHITSLFMGASNSDIARSASAMADNVLFCWQDELKLERGKKGVTVFVDRIEGHHPGNDRLFFIKNADDVDWSQKENRLAAQVDRQCNNSFAKTDLHHAERMINAIQALQGLSGLAEQDERT